MIVPIINYEAEKFQLAPSTIDVYLMHASSWAFAQQRLRLLRNTLPTPPSQSIFY